MCAWISLTGEGQGEGGFSPKNLFAEKSPSLCPSLQGREKKKKPSSVIPECIYQESKSEKRKPSLSCHREGGHRPTVAISLWITSEKENEIATPGMVSSQREARKPQEDYNLRGDLQSLKSLRGKKKPSVPTSFSLFFLALAGEKFQDGLPLKSFELLIFQTEALFSILRLSSSEPMANIIYHHFLSSSIGGRKPLRTPFFSVIARVVKNSLRRRIKGKRDEKYYKL